MYQIGMMTYANMAPYRQLGEPKGCRFIYLTPRQSVKALQDNKIIAAAVPVGGLPMVEEHVEYIGQFGIAAKSKVDSVMLFSDQPFEQMDSSTCIHLSVESESSIRLLFLLLGYEHGFDNLPRLTEDINRLNGNLLIGDTALKQYYRMSDQEKFSMVTDLAAKWYQQHGLAFVFARWVVHKKAPLDVKSALFNWLEDFRQREADLIDQCTATTALELNLPASKVNHYLKLIRRCLDQEDMEGQRLFFKEIKKYGRTPLFDRDVV